MNDVIDVSFVQKELVSKSDVIDPSTLTKFRKLRLKDGQVLDLLISEAVETPEPVGVAQPEINCVD